MTGRSNAKKVTSDHNIHLGILPRSFKGFGYKVILWTEHTHKIRYILNQPVFSKGYMDVGLKTGPTD